EEFVNVLRAVWTADGPIDHHGEFYDFEDFQTDVRPLRGTVPISVGGSSQQAYEVGGRTGDVFGLWGEPLAETAEQIAWVNAVADAAGRPRPRIWNSFRPIVAATDELAWEKAYKILARVEQAQGRAERQHPSRRGVPERAADQRRLAAPAGAGRPRRAARP